MANLRPPPLRLRRGFMQLVEIERRIFSVAPKSFRAADRFAVDGKESRSCNIDIRARTSSVGITQSIGMEWQFRVGQIKRSGPVPRVPPTTRRSRPSII